MTRLLALATLIGSVLYAGGAWAAGGACPSGVPVKGNNCYFIAANGSDQNDGLSEKTPWLHAPGMPTCSGNCAKVQNSWTAGGSNSSGGFVPGVGLIFRGGDTWHEGDSNQTPYTGGTFHLKWGGGPNCVYEGDQSGCFYVGVDRSWYNSSICGSSWCRPKLNGDNPLSTKPVSSCKYQIGDANQLLILSDSLTSHIYLDSFELLGLCDDETPSSPNYQGAGNGYTDVMVVDNGNYYIRPDAMTIKKNLYLHGWTVTTATEGNGGTTCTVMGGGGYESYIGIVVDGADSDPATCNWAIFPNIIHMKDSFVRNTTQGVAVSCHDIHDNVWEYLDQPYILTHNNILECNADSPDGYATPNVFYNNIVRHSTMNVDLWFCPDTNPEYWFNNLLYDTDGEGWSIAGTIQYPSCTWSGGVNLFNNTFANGFDAPCGYAGSVDPGQIHYLNAYNNHLIGTSWYTSSPECTGGPSSATNITLTDAQGAAQGYTTGSPGKYEPDTCANEAAGPCAPTARTNATVGSGSNLQKYCDQLATFQSEYAIGTEAAQACRYGTTDACAYDATTHTVVCPARKAAPRPTNGAWDVGAYQCVPTADGGCAQQAAAVPDGGPGGVGASGGSAAGGGSGNGAGGSAPSSGGSGAATAAGGSGATQGAGPSGNQGSCGCSVPGSEPVGSGALALVGCFGLVALRRRRGRRSSDAVGS